MSDKAVAEYKAYLESIGDSIVVVADDEIVKTHVHTNDPGLAIQTALSHGSLSKIKIDNMREEHQEKLKKEAEKKTDTNEEAASSVELAKEPEPEMPHKDMGFISADLVRTISSRADRP
jgi:dihydroxyacetone kinase-like predicted kinase